MLDFSKVQSYYIACGYTDMRKQIDGLVALVELQFGKKPDETSIFLFCQQFQFLLISWPLKPLFRQTLVQQHISRTIPMQGFDPIRTVATKQEDRCFIRLFPKL